jgi:hypothetical protein
MSHFLSGVNLNSQYPRPSQLALSASMPEYPLVRLETPLWVPTDEQQRLISQMKGAGKRPLWVVGFGNRKRGSEHVGPVGDALTELLDALRFFVNFLASEGDVWELWNEPNEPGFWLPKPDPNAYAAFCLAAEKVIRAKFPDAQVFAGALSRPCDPDALVFLSVLKSRGVFATCGLSIHPYGDGAPKVALSRALEAVRSVVGPLPPVLASEYGLGDDQAHVCLLGREGINLANVDPAPVWSKGRARGKQTGLVHRVEPNGDLPYLYAKGKVGSGYRTVYAQMRADRECVVSIGTRDDESRPVLIGPEWRRVGATVKTKDRGSDTRQFVIVGDPNVPFEVRGSVCVEDPNVSDAEYAECVFDQWEDDRARCAGIAERLGYVGLFWYGLQDTDNAGYKRHGVFSAGGRAKVSGSAVS